MKQHNSQRIKHLIQLILQHRQSRLKKKEEKIILPMERSVSHYIIHKRATLDKKESWK